MREWLFLSLCLIATVTLAQPAPDAEVTSVRSDVETGKYEEALAGAKERIDRGALTEEDLVELHKYAGLAAFNLGRREEAERHFGALLKINPDFNLDPFVIAPPAIAFYEEQRKKLGASLEILRERRAERKRTEDEARQRAEAEAQRRRMEELAKRATVRTVERRSLLVNFVPFGAGQFQQGRRAMGWALALTQVALAATSLGAYFAYDGLLREQAVQIETAPGQIVTVTTRGIPASRERDANSWRLTRNISGIGFYAFYALGVADALWRHTDQVVTTEPAPPRTSDLGSRPTVRPHFFPTQGGAGAGLTLSF